MSRVFYSNEPDGLIIVTGEIGEVAECVDCCAFRDNDADLQAELQAAAEEFGVTEPFVRFETSAELTLAYNGKPT